MNKIRVAVTGAAGQVGSVLVRRMSEFPHIDTVAICRNNISAGLIHYVAPECDIRVGSITDIDSAQQLLGDCDVIVNCALAIVSGQPKKSRLLNKAMIDSFSHIKNLKLLIHMSTISVYGANIDSKRSQRSVFERPCPDGDYGRSKLYIEQYAKRLCLSMQIKYYILRLGHVYGAKMDRSRELIELAKNPFFRLPFNGDLPSNMIHVERLAAMIIALLSDPLTSGIYNVAETQTWRQAFDWHTQAIGLPPVKGMSNEDSEHLKSIYRSPSVMRDIGNWLRSLPILSLIRYPAIFESIYRFLHIIPPSMTSRLATVYKCLDVRRKISFVSKNNNVIISPAYFLDAMPGTYLKVSLEAQVSCPSQEELFNQLRIWYQRFSQPRWLPDSVHERPNIS